MEPKLVGASLFSHSEKRHVHCSTGHSKRKSWPIGGCCQPRQLEAEDWRSLTISKTRLGMKWIVPEGVADRVDVDFNPPGVNPLQGIYVYTVVSEARWHVSPKMSFR